MARPERHDADYFPFYVKEGKTLFILESKYGLQGIGFFTNLMRFLTKQPDHHICIHGESDRLYFFAQIRCPEEIGMDMLSLMAKTGKIDKKLWGEKRVVVSGDLINSLHGAYQNRKNDIIGIDEIRVSYKDNQISYNENPISSTDKPQTKLKETKLKEIYVAFDSFWKVYPKKIGKKEAMKAWEKATDKPTIDKIIKTVNEQKKSPQWTKDDGQYIPNPATWINRGGWDDEATGRENVKGNTQTGSAVYIVCKRCGAEYIKGETVKINGNDCCQSCPEITKRADDIRKLTGGA